MLKKLLATVAVLCSTQAYAQTNTQAGSGEIADWSGPHLGVTAGYARSDFEPKVDPFFVDQGLDEDLNHRGDGWTTGLMAGYDLQSGAWVYGIDLTASIAHVRGRAENDLMISVPGFNDGAPFDVDQTQISKVRDLYSARLRVGRVFGPMLVYAAGGIGGATVETDFEVRSIFGDAVSEDREFHTGFTFSAGVEYRLSRRFTARLEYAHYNFGADPHQEIPFDLNQNVVSTGISYRFGG